MSPSAWNSTLVRDVARTVLFSTAVYISVLCGAEPLAALALVTATWIVVDAWKDYRAYQRYCEGE